MNRSALHQLSRMRIADARVLLRAGRPQGAYYLSGYAIECGLKACIAKQVHRYDFPDKRTVADSYTHNLDQLLKVAGLSPTHAVELRSNPSLAINWGIVKDWSEQDRYDPGITAVDARDIYSAVTARTNGVLVWLRKHW